ncbi:hypothetical protein CJU94_00890 [Paraburkholderia aromaticivorans]|uniref:Uncharacterized protein n=1 Tax=Paraburkholderia aromaticivorans TaxID=2026199 RepID=A0A248VDD3_9BURK|nr:hypothetical protein CJU94_00890 [Paraburkholderia aromaticivorans]
MPRFGSPQPILQRALRITRLLNLSLFVDCLTAWPGLSRVAPRRRGRVFIRMHGASHRRLAPRMRRQQGTRRGILFKAV